MVSPIVPYDHVIIYAHTHIGGLQNLVPELTQPLKVDPIRPPSGFSPFEEQIRQPYAYDEARELGLPPNQSHLQQRLGVDPGFGSHPEQNYNNMAANKVSRFAKFFDGKSRDGAPMTKPPGPGIPPSTSPLQSQRGDQANFGGVTPNPGDIRVMDDIFTMLNNSTHVRFISLPIIYYLTSCFSSVAVCLMFPMLPL